MVRHARSTTNATQTDGRRQVTDIMGELGLERILRSLSQEPQPGATAMSILKWTLIFFVFALIAALLGFGGVAGAAAGVAELLFYVFLVVAVISLAAGLMRERRA